MEAYFESKVIVAVTSILSCSKEDAVRYLTDAMIISYPHNWGGQFQDKKFWCGTINGGVEDWHLKEELVSQAEELGINWFLLTYHKDLSISIPRWKITIDLSSPNPNNKSEVDNG